MKIMVILFTLGWIVSVIALIYLWINGAIGGLEKTNKEKDKINRLVLRWIIIGVICFIVSGILLRR